MSDITYELVSESMLGRNLYKLSQPMPWQEYMPLTNSYEQRTTEYFVVSLGKDGDTALFPAESDGSITQFDALHSHPFWIVDYDASIEEWLDGKGNAD